MKLSVNLNKIALLRNARGENYPQIEYFANKAIDLGVDGLTLHPRPDHRHATSDDVINISNLTKNKIETHFLKRKDELDVYKYNAIRVKGSDLAHEIYFQLEAGESNFFDLSRTYSLDKKIFPDSVVGPKNTVGLHPVIKEKLRSYDIGNLIKPFQIDKWWLIIKLLEKKQAILDQKTSKQMALELCEVFVHDKVNLSLIHI